MKNPGKYKSVSAFAPIANPINSPWGQKAFKGYFGEDNKGLWAEHDSTELVKNWKGEPLDILIDVVCLPLATLVIGISANYCMFSCRVPKITSTSKASFCLKILSRRLRARERSMCGGRTDMIIAISRWRALRMTISSMQQKLF